VTSKDSSKRPLDERIDAALASWPLAERDAGAWENLAARTEARIARAAGGEAAGAAALLEAPLPATPPEVQQSASLGTGGVSPIESAPGRLNVESASRIAAGPGESKMSSQPPESRGRDRRSLKDLAKLASSPSLTPTPPPTSKTAPVSVSPLATTRRSDPGDSGIVDLKMMAQLDPEAAERAKDTKLANSELFDDDPEEAASAPVSAKGPTAPPSSAKTPAAAAPASSPKTLVSSTADSRTAPASPTVTSRGQASQAQPAPKTEEGKTNVLVWVAGAAGVLAAAAAAIIMLQSPSSSPAASAPPVPAASVAAAPAAKPAPPPRAAESVAATDTPPPDTAPEVNPASLATAAGPARGPSRPGAANKAVAAGPDKSVSVAGKAEATPAHKPDLEAKIPTGPGLGPSSGGLEGALKQAAGPTDNPSSAGGAATTSAPQFEPGSVPQKPSAGAITSGVASAMSQARSCLGLDDPISKAAVTFESSGNVQGVVVSGFAAGKPAEACIKAALSKAKVPPFAQSIYTQSFTIRPN
jgi:hypothetical protein